MDDKVQKGRQARGLDFINRPMPKGDNHYARRTPERLARGEAHGQSRVTAVDVTSIRQRYAAGSVTLKALAKEYGVTWQAIRRIVLREVWKSVE